ncbi:SLC1A2 [Cordylochernes scorpioides]|uniref:Amino acid transporter n=1 Tax=Cordylochernes scorpioides TaxID=51811 RepID=A0ABY6KNS1_9ARAC|nr:SLC1A2 [Cordylochernes scorpioides]
MALCSGKNSLLILTVLGVILGVVAGIVIRLLFTYGPYEIMLVSFLGEIFMNMLKLVILPLIFSSMVSGLANLDTKSGGRIGLLTFTYFLFTTLMAVIVGTILVLIIHPGSPKMRRSNSTQTSNVTVTAMDTFLDLVRNIFPENLVQAAISQVTTIYIKQPYNATSSNYTLVPQVVYRDGTNSIGIIVFCIIFGAIANQLGQSAAPVVDFFTSFEGIIMGYVRGIMW